jgi:hypothetical protein
MPRFRATERTDPSGRRVIATASCLNCNVKDLLATIAPFGRHYRGRWAPTKRGEGQILF